MTAAALAVAVELRDALDSPAIQVESRRARRKAWYYSGPPLTADLPPLVGFFYRCDQAKLDAERDAAAFDIADAIQRYQARFSRIARERSRARRRALRVAR